MEISEYLRLIKDRIWILILIPLAAAIVVVGLLLARSPEYEATATVAVPAIIGGEDSQYAGPSGARTFVADFVAVITSPELITRISQATDVAPELISEGLSARAVDLNGSLVEVTYLTRQQATAGPVAQAAAGETIAFLFQAPAQIAQQQVDEAQRAVDEAQVQLDAFAAQTGFMLDRAYEAKAAQLSSLELQEIEARAAGDTTRSARLEDEINARSAELAELAPQVATYTNLAAQRTQAAGRLDVARDLLEQANARVEAGKSGKVVVSGSARQVSRASAIVRKGTAAVGAGLFLSVALIVLLEFAGHRRPALTTNLRSNLQQWISSSDLAARGATVARQVAQRAKQALGVVGRPRGQHAPRSTAAEAKSERVEAS